MSVSLLSRIFCAGLMSLTLISANVLAQEASDKDKDTSSKSTAKDDSKESKDTKSSAREDDKSATSRGESSKSATGAENSATNSADRAAQQAKDNANPRSQAARSSNERSTSDQNNQFRFDQRSSTSSRADQSDDRQQSRFRTDRRDQDNEDRLTPPDPPNERDFDDSSDSLRSRARDRDDQYGDRGERRFSSEPNDQDRNDRFRSRFGDRFDRERDDDRDYARRDDDRRDDDRRDSSRDDRDRDYARNDRDQDRDRDRDRDRDQDQDINLGLSVRLDDSDRLVIQERATRGVFASVNVLPGDVILSVNNQPIRSQEALIRQIRYYDGTGALPVVILRNGTRQTVYIRNVSQYQYSDYQDQDYPREYALDDEEQAWLGVYLNARYQNSAVVQSVQRGSAASEAGLQPNDWIVSVNNQRIMSPRHLSQVIRDMEPGEQIRMEVSRRVTGEVTATLTDRPGYSDTSQNRRPERPVNYEE